MELQEEIVCLCTSKELPFFFAIAPYQPEQNPSSAGEA